MRIEILNKKLIEYISKYESATGLEVFTGFITNDLEITERKVIVKFGSIEVISDSEHEAYISVCQKLKDNYDE